MLFLYSVLARYEWHLAQRNIKKIVEYAKRHSAVTGFVIFPVLVGLDEEEYPFQEIIDTLTEFTRLQGLPTHNLLPAFSGKEGSTLWVSPFEQHPNEIAHRIAADSLRPFVGSLLGTSSPQSVINNP